MSLSEEHKGNSVKRTLNHDDSKTSPIRRRPHSRACASSHAPNARLWVSRWVYSNFLFCMHVLVTYLHRMQREIAKHTQCLTADLPPFPSFVVAALNVSPSPIPCPLLEPDPTIPSTILLLWPQIRVSTPKIFSS